MKGQLISHIRAHGFNRLWLFYLWRLKRWKKPHYIEPLLDLVEIVNFFKLVPTFFSILITPRHFFRKTRYIMDDKFPWYKTPLAYLIKTLTLTFILAAFVYPKLIDVPSVRAFLFHYDLSWANWLISLSKLEIYGGLLLFAFLSPLWMTLICRLLYQTYVFIEQAKRISISLPNRLDVARPMKGFPELLVPSSWQTYRRMNWRPFLWNLCYFGITAFLMLHIVSVALFLSAYGLMEFGRQLKGAYLPPVALVPFLLIPAAFARYLLAEPYIELLRASQRQPSLRLKAADIEGLRFEMKTLEVELKDLVEVETLRKKSKDRKAQKWWKEKQANRVEAIYKVLPLIHDKLSKLNTLWRHELFDYKEQKGALLNERYAVCRENLPIGELAQLIEQIRADQKLMTTVADTVNQILSTCCPGTVLSALEQEVAMH